MITSSIQDIRDAFSSPLGKRLVLSVVLTSTLVTLLITAVEIVFDYQERTDDVINSHSEIDRIHGRTIVENLWIMNDIGAQLTVQSIAELPTVDYITLEWEGGRMITAGTPVPTAEYTSIYPLVRHHLGDDHEMGTLTLYSSFDGVRRELTIRYLYFLAANLMKSILVSLVALSLFHRLATVHIRKITAFAAKANLHKRPDVLSLDRPEHINNQHDELQQLSYAINAMATRQFAFHSRISQHKDSLETEVVQQGQALALAQQRLLEKDRLATIGSLVGLVAHELRNPLGTLKSSVFLVQKSFPAKYNTATIDKAMERIERSIQRCDHTIENLRSFGVRRALNSSYFDLGILLRKTLDRDKQDWGVLNIALHIDGPAPVHADSHQVTQVICNLLTNAVQAMQDNKSGSDKATLICLQTRNGCVEMTVDDHGSGIGELEPERLFDPLFTTKISGFGMGLSLSRYFVEEMGGELFLENSQVTSGATAMLRLPIAKNNMDPPTAYSAAPSLP